MEFHENNAKRLLDAYEAIAASDAAAHAF